MFGNCPSMLIRMSLQKPSRKNHCSFTRSAVEAAPYLRPVISVRSAQLTDSPPQEIRRSRYPQVQQVVQVEIDEAAARMSIKEEFSLRVFREGLLVNKAAESH